MYAMFSNATSFNANISNWDVSSVIVMPFIFNNASSFNQDLSSWDVSNVTSMSQAFNNTVLLSDENKCAIHASWSTNSAWTYDWSGFCTTTQVFQPQTKVELQTAVNLWVSDKASALVTDGEIKTWDMS